MPALESIKEIRSGRKPIGSEFPRHYEWRTNERRLSRRFSMPVSQRLNTWMQEYNADKPPERQITLGKIIRASRNYELKAMRWNSCRFDNANQPGEEPTGWEHLYLGKNWDPELVALRISMLGIKAQKEHPSVINQLLIGGGFQSLSVTQLIEADGIISEMLRHEKEQMTDDARLFRKTTIEHIDALPRDLTRSYYFKGDTYGEIVVAGTVLQELPPHTSFRQSINWMRVLNYAHSTGIKDYSDTDFHRGRDIMVKLSHMTSSFIHGMLDLMRTPQEAAK